MKLKRCTVVVTAFLLHAPGFTQKNDTVKTALKPEVKLVVWEKKTFLMKRASLEIEKLPAFFAESYHSIYEALNRAGYAPPEPPYAIYYAVDRANRRTDIAAAVAIPESAKVEGDFLRLTIPECRALLVTHLGPYENMPLAYAELDTYVAENKLTRTYVLEQYFSDPAKENDPAKWRTDIYYIIK